MKYQYLLELANLAYNGGVTVEEYVEQFDAADRKSAKKAWKEVAKKEGR